MNTDLDTLRLFVRVAQRGSFSAAGRDLGLPQSTASRLVAGLEEQLGTRLFIRTTRAVRLTEAGLTYLARVEPLLAALDEAAHETRGGLELRGTLRVGLSSSMALRQVLPNLERFVDRHPQVVVQLLTDDHRQDLVGEGVDIALRFGSLDDSSAIARRLTTWPIVLVASPAYLARSPAIAEPADLARHRMIAGPNWRQGNLHFRHGETAVSLRLEPQLHVAINEAATAAAVDGLGIAYMGLGGCERELIAGSLVRILPDHDIGSIDLHAVYPAGRASRPAARAFAEHMVSVFSGQPKPD